ncbi:TAXI family TRAP transporter solute-binding subunit [Chelativorans alearense]|uniref:TAXI family TRAP transporter solute-binding subunit n=1 Tax=Chelativorans alearense TaxID=2681495 RepID=UPI0013D37827|nr:TAXI family TRAP transporter solute-binding subunit [Chelativorans alearense]
MISRFLAVAAITVGLSGAASAQTISIGTNPQGSLAYATGAAVSKVAIEEGGIRMRVVPQGGPNVVVPLVNNGELEFSIANGVAAAFAYTGQGEFSSPNENIRMVAVLFDLYSGFIVPKDSDIHTLQDLQGKRVASDFLTQVAVQINAEATLNTVGMSYDDVQRVPVPDGVRGVEDLEAGNVDATFFSLSSGRTKQADAALGGIRILPVEKSEEANAKIEDISPGAWVAEVKPGPNFPGITEPQGAYTTPFVILAGADVPEEVVYNLVKALHANKKALVAANGAFNGFDPGAMHTDVGVPFHPGAEQFYTEADL